MPKASRSLPPHVLISAEPHLIIIDGVELLAREPTATEYAAIAREELEMINGILVPKPTYAKRMIEMCVIDPPIPNADVLRVVFAGKLSTELERLMGGTDADIKNE